MLYSSMVAVKRATQSCAMAYQYWPLFPEVAAMAVVKALFCLVKDVFTIDGSGVTCRAVAWLQHSVLYCAMP